MILREFSKYLQKHNDELLTNKTTPLVLLHCWLRSVIVKTPKNNIEKIIHKELLFCENDNGDYLIAGKSKSGRVLAGALIKFAQSYKNYTRSKWVDMTEKSLHKDNKKEK